MGIGIRKDIDMAKVGRKGKFDYWLSEDGLLLVEGWARDGLTEADIAHNIGISVSTLSEWKNRFPEFLTVLKQTKEVVDRRVENALYKKAMNGDITAMIFWLKNRKYKEWRDRYQNDLTTPEPLQINQVDYTKYTKDELETMKALLKRQDE